MITPRTSRRLVILALASVCALVLAGLGVATQQAVQLQLFEALTVRRDALEKSYDEKRALALSKLDAVVAPILARESARPTEYFVPFYKPSAAEDERTHQDITATTQIPSPLRAETVKKPSWMLLHFQAAPPDLGGRWNSPQVENDYPAGSPVWALLAGEEARPQDWLETLRQRCQLLELITKLEDAVGSEEGGSKAAAETLTAAAGHPLRIARPGSETHGTPSDRTSAEFVRRAAQLVQLEQDSRPGATCFPEMVAVENLVPGLPKGTLEAGSENCVEVTPTSMTPIWLPDLALDGRVYLAFLRVVKFDIGGICHSTVQGVLIDWDEFREQFLEPQVRDLFPHAALIPISELSPVQASPVHAKMWTLPVQLETGPQPTVTPPTLSSGFKVGLTLAWGVTLLALAGIVYGTMKYVTIAERRMRFVSAVTHELRTPLTSFQLYSDLLADMPREDASLRRQYAETLRGESKRLAKLVENVLAYSRIGTRGPALNWRAVSPREMLDAVAEATTEPCKAAGKTLAVEVRCPPDLRIETDSEFVLQILTNLVENACKYSAGADDPHIWLCAAPTADGTVAFEVDDAGPGVASNERREIFEPFRRGNSTGVKNAGGVGLGLALSRYWASCLGGGLSLRRSPRGGSRYSNFVLTLPLKHVG